MKLGKRIDAPLWRHPWHLLWILAAYLPFLGRVSVPLTGDQKVYLSIAMEMREAGSILKPLLFGQGSYYKPPFEYWATLLGWKIFGFNFWGALLPSVLAVLVTAWLIGEIAVLLGQKRWFVTSGLWFAGALGTVTYGTTAQMEIYVCLFYAASWWTGLKYLNAPLTARRKSWLYAAFAIAGVASLVKSPLYSVFWVAGYMSYLVIAGEWELFRSRHLYLAWVLGIVLASLWYVAILVVDGPHFWSDYAMRETWDKKSGNQGSWGSLWLAFLYFSYPFTLLMVPAFNALFKARSRLGDLLLFSFCWAWPPAVFFTFYPYRIKPYLFILVPLASILVDYGYFRGGRSNLFKIFSRITGVSFFLILNLVGFVLWRAGLVPGWIAVGFAISGMVGLACSFQDAMRGLVLSGLAAVFFFRAAAVSIGEQDFAGLHQAMEAAPSRLERVAMIDENENIWHEIGYLSTGLKIPMTRLKSFAQAAEFIARGGAIILNEDQAQQSYHSLSDQLGKRVPGRSLVRTPWKRWKVRSHFPFKELILQGKVGVPDFDQQTHREFEVVWLK